MQMSFFGASLYPWVTVLGPFCQICLLQVKPQENQAVPCSRLNTEEQPFIGTSGFCSTPLRPYSTFPLNEPLPFFPESRVFSFHWTSMTLWYSFCQMIPITWVLSVKSPGWVKGKQNRTMLSWKLHWYDW